MSLLTFLFEAVLISLSGVMAPGPMTTVTVGKGNQSPFAGTWIAVGHGIIEFPLMIFLLYGFGAVLNLFYVKASLAVIGGLFLLMMSVGMFRSIGHVEMRSNQYARSPIIAGILLSAGNPYFLIWWATVGVSLIFRSVDFGTMGFIVFAVVHWLCDFLWYSFLSSLSFKGGQFFGQRFQKIVFTLCGMALLFFSGKFMIDGVKGFL